MKRLTMLGLAAILLLSATSALATNVLYYEDSVRGASVIPGALALAGATGTAATSESDFTTKLEAGGWDAVLYGIEGASYSDSAGLQTALSNYVTGGGALIASTWLTDSGPSGVGPDIFGIMDAHYTGGVDTSPLVNDGSFIFSGISGNVTIGNSAYGTWDETFTPAAGGTGYAATGGGQFQFIVGNDGRTIMNGPFFTAFPDTATGSRLVANELEHVVAASTVPEPGSMMLFGTGLVGLAGTIRRKLKK